MQEKSCSVYGVYQNKNSILKICEIFFEGKNCENFKINFENFKGYR